MEVQGRIALKIVALVTALLGATSAVASEAEAVPGEYIVKLKSQNSIFSVGLLSHQLNAEVKSIIADAGIVVIHKPAIMLSGYVIKSLNENPLVEYAEPNFIYHANKTPNDPSLEKLWGIKNVGQLDKQGGAAGTPGIDVGAEQAWDLSTGSEKTIVAVIDTGVDYTHPDIKDNAWVNIAEANGKAGVDDDRNGYVDDIYGVNFSDAAKPTSDPKDDHGHGTHCSGTIGARGDDGKGIVGVNWSVRIMAVKFLSATGSGSLEGAIKAIDYATKNGAKIMSNSWGGGGYSLALKEAIQRAHDAGALFVAAAGNDSSNNDVSPGYPASYDIPNVLSVAAINNKGDLASFSNYGKKSVHVAAPGVNIFSSVISGGYQSMSGTSMATPHVSGIAALLFSHEPNLTNVELKQRIIRTARPWSTLKGKVSSAGIANAYLALSNTNAPLDPDDPANWRTQAVNYSTAHPYNAKENQKFEISVSGAKEISLFFETYDTEAGYDLITFFDRNGKKLGELSGVGTDSFSQAFAGDYVKVIFTSDDSMQKYGFDITKIAFR